MTSVPIHARSRCQISWSWRDIAGNCIGKIARVILIPDEASITLKASAAMNSQAECTRQVEALYSTG